MKFIRNKARKGFTLVEIMVATTVLVLVSGMVLSFVVENLRASYVSEQKNQLNNDIRRFTQELSKNAKDANYFRLYSTFENADRDSAGDHLTEGTAGNFLLLVHQAEPDLSVTGVRPIAKIVGYFLDAPDGETKGPLRKFEIEYDPASNSSPEALIPDDSTKDTQQILITETEGIADGNLFYNLWNRSLLVNGYIIKGNDNKRITETYNFTISPRG